ncbi:hypothetical protein [Flavimarina sp. Hel_I_48]|uniref:hypothetical protein n=1 Tax=Flavimarina sp. Hel_I_48 TaxID=1392488 RepID=UPI0004DF631F|nr:hypothetical protein [Flavimarina sp. Hel_I_48]
MNNSEFKKLLYKYTAETATETERLKVEYFLYKLQQNNQDLPVPLGDAQHRGIKNRIDSALASPVKTVHLQVKKILCLGCGNRGFNRCFSIPCIKYRAKHDHGFQREGRT